MTAYVVAARPDPGMEYTKGDFYAALEKNGIRTGIRESRIAAILKKKIYDREVLIAEGTPVQNGEDAYFEYRFELNTKNRKPEIREDGSVDYTSINAITCVNEGDVLAVYHPPVQGKPGETVRGKVVMPKPAKDVRPFMTVGCYYNENTRMYTANISGRVEVNNNKLSVMNFREFQQDIDNVFGDVYFNGDILIHGSVKPGVKIVAEKTVTIDGSLEGSDVVAKGDILIRGGVMGAGSAKIESGGDILMDFVEYATVKAGGNIRANSFLDSKVEAGGTVQATGKLGAIVGGSVFGLSRVEC
ncbi:MAG: FapA family protein, partial [Lachnospiraceae bacterium]|nr:FapA family protein [Lachnospiraceae bacterium]